MSGLFALSGKTAIVTGAARGLGAASARALAEAGAQVVLADLDREALERQVAHLRNDGFDCHIMVLDVTDSAGRADALRMAENVGGGLDILVNNAGIMLRKPAISTSDTEFRSVLDVNVVAMAAFSGEAFPLLAERKGRIINLSSIMGHVGRAGQATYVASKHAVVGLTRAHAAEFGSRGITVNAIAPGYFTTEMNTAIVADGNFYQSVIDRTPLRRWGAPEEIGGPLVFFASAASAFITGHVLTLDGGLTATVPGPSRAEPE